MIKKNKNYWGLVIILISNTIIAQVSHITRSKESYTQDVFPYKGVRAIQIDEVSSPDHEENVFIFSKVEKGANPDTMYFQRFTKTDGIWGLKTLFTITHKGIISAWGSRKGFNDYNKDKSVDAFFIFGLYDADFKQQTVHLIFSQFDKVYSIESNVSDNFATNKFSDNFETLKANTKNEILDYWNKLDKLDK
jgi:hypothetical protein